MVGGGSFWLASHSFGPAWWCRILVPRERNWLRVKHGILSLEEEEEEPMQKITIRSEPQVHE
jgi:hypothetical protein